MALLFRETRAEIPGQLGGLPVTELAPLRVFPDIRNWKRCCREPSRESCASGRKRKERRPCAGNQLEEIVLPDTVKKIGRYCFYNCKELRELEVPEESWIGGSGVFTGCHRIQRISIRGKNTEFSLREVLEESGKSSGWNFWKKEKR